MTENNNLNRYLETAQGPRRVDIFYHFINAKTLEQGRVNIKHRSDITRGSTLSFIIDKTIHFKTFICLEYILDTKI